ncbi:hypothetical protein, partial [Enterobacter hormaechei]|uniref:hypothetical protein n=1 Tax=Enterobacter hormaechei TaxID=158836 RepID=UPI001C2BC12E
NLVSFVFGQLVVAHQCFSLGREERRLYQLAALLPIALIIRNRADQMLKIFCYQVIKFKHLNLSPASLCF